jgi:predicted nuclease of restriction endonuclease-like (RecB) superfamily
MTNDLTPAADPSTPSPLLLADLQEIIRRGKSQAVAAVNSALTLTYWHVGQRINTDVLHGERAAYGQQVVVSVAESLVAQYGKSFEAKNLRRMMQFAEVFSDLEIVVPLARQLSWSHFLLLIPLPSHEARWFYGCQAAQAAWGKRELIRQIERKAFERSAIADSKLALAAPDTTPDLTHALAGSFKDPYFFDFLDLPQGYLENDLEQALIRELEQFILELGKGHRKIMTFSKESEFEAAVIHELRQRGWGDAEVIKNPSEADLLANWKRILFENNRGKDRLNEVPLTDGEMQQIMEQITRCARRSSSMAFINGKTVAITRDNPRMRCTLARK